jgi:hypothetical protein
MKNNARLYLPWLVVSAFASTHVAPARGATRWPGPSPASAERLDGGCLLHRLSDDPVHWTKC